WRLTGPRRPLLWTPSSNRCTIWGGKRRFGPPAGPERGRRAMGAVKSPLEGIRVLDLGRHQAGPRCAQVLARLGAEVIKIERLEGEETRTHGPWARGQSAYFVQYNSGKKSLAMDLRQEQAKCILRDLVRVSDVLVQNF